MGCDVEGKMNRDAAVEVDQGNGSCEEGAVNFGLDVKLAHDGILLSI
jgi:hypothetical protein